MNPKIHLRGLILAVVGFGLTYVLIATQLALRGKMIAVAGAPLALGMIGLVELVSGYPFYKIAAKWDSIHVGIRLLLGLVIIALAVVAMGFGAMVYLSNS